MFTHCQIVFQILLVDSSKRSQKVSRCRPQPFDCVDMNFSHSIAIIVSRPFFLTMTNRVVRPVDFVVALPFVCVTGGSLLCITMHMLSQGLPISMIAHSQAALATFSANSFDHWRPIIFIRAMSRLLVGSSSRRIYWIAVFFAFFPRAAETFHQFQYLCLAMHFRSTSHKRWPGFACATCVLTGVTNPTLGKARSRVRLCTLLAIATQLVVARFCSQRIWFQYRCCKRSGTFGICN